MSSLSLRNEPCQDTSASYIGRLQHTLLPHDAPQIKGSLEAIRAFLADDLAAVEATVQQVLHGQPETPLHNSVLHLLSLSGKRLRPLCSALAARIGERGFGPAAHAVAVAVELVHNATLLHDDVVDIADTRRGQPTARTLYGNAASVYAGDWLLIDALQRLERAGCTELMVQLLAVLREMLDGEALQLDRRGMVDASVEDYLRIVRGKTASLFRFALAAGGTAGGVSAKESEALGRFGMAMGVAFQITDDVLDLSGQSEALGKSVFADLHEGKFTLPLLYAMERRPALRELLRQALSESDALYKLDREVSLALHETGALTDARQEALRLSTEAMAALHTIAPCPARRALEQVALALVHRTH